MKKFSILLLCLATVATTQAQLFKKKKNNLKDSLRTAQTIETKKEIQPKKDWSKLNLTNRAADHFMIQFGSESWTNTPDSVKIGGGFSRHFNMYLMLDKPFKTNPHFSLGYGIGIGSSNMFFDKTYVNLKSTANRLPFTNVATANHFEKFKVTTIYLEVPVEVRFFTNPEEPNKSWKFAIGAKVGTLLKSYSKGKNLVGSNGASVFGPTFIEKESNKRFFNGTRLALTGRVAYGNVGLHGGFSITPVLKEGLGAPMNNVSIGLTLSGL